jgi:hypothetical protein
MSTPRTRPLGPTRSAAIRAAAPVPVAKAALSAYEANLGAKLADLEALMAERTIAGHTVRVLNAPAAALPASTGDHDGE